jgi:hypothetical protein
MMADEIEMDGSRQDYFVYGGESVMPGTPSHVILPIFSFTKLWKLVSFLR